MIDNEHINYILKEYPAWKIKSIFKMGVDKYIQGDNIEQKIDDYEMFYNIPVEEEMFFNIVNNVSLNNRISLVSINHLKGFVCDYLSICIPSFGRKWTEFKKDSLPTNLLSIIEQYN